MNLVLVFFVILTISLYPVYGCGTNNVVCISESTYQFCFTVGTQVVITDGVLTCPTGTVCTENGTYVCTDSSSTDSTSTTTSSITVATGPPETCTETGKYPADSCDQYWECVYVMWWYELVLQSCGTGLSYDATSQECVANGACDSTTTTTTTTTDSTITETTTSVTGPPETCTESGTYPADACNQYWECVYVMWWYELVLQTCGANLYYNANSQACEANSTCIL